MVAISLSFMVHWLLAGIVILVWVLFFISQKPSSSVVEKGKYNQASLEAEKDLFQKQVEIERAKDKLEEFTKKANELSQQNEDSNSKLNTLEREISEKAGRLKKIDSELSEKEEYFHHITAIKEKYQESLRLNMEIRLKQEAVSKSEKDILFLENSIEEQQARLVKLCEEEVKEIQTKERNISSLDQKMAHKKNELAEIQTRIDTLNGSQEVLKKEKNETERDLKERRNKLHEISEKLVVIEAKLTMKEKEHESYEVNFENKLQALTQDTQNLMIKKNQLVDDIALQKAKFKEVEISHSENLRHFEEKNHQLRKSNINIKEAYENQLKAKEVLNERVNRLKEEEKNFSEKMRQYNDFLEYEELFQKKKELEIEFEILTKDKDILEKNVANSRAEHLQLSDTNEELRGLNKMLLNSQTSIAESVKPPAQVPIAAPSPIKLEDNNDWIQLLNKELNEAKVLTALEKRTQTNRKIVNDSYIDIGIGSKRKKSSNYTIGG